MSTKRRFVFPDPIAGSIELPVWLARNKEEPAIRRMLFIRQLGLKAYIDYPGAIHTRFSHALGTMHLSGKLVDLLCLKLRDKGKTTLETNLKDNRNLIMASGFLHDIAHGPFSHAVDFVMKNINGNTHESLAEQIVLNKISTDLENWDVNRKAVADIINKKHAYPYIYEIINGPLDVDKLDYLLRDAHHVGLRYSFDLDSCLGNYTILGDETEPELCHLGLDNTPQATVTTELFVVFWKSMYDLIYYVEDSRIAEKMLEKALLMSKDAPDIKNSFTDIDRFLELDDYRLLDLLKKQGGKSKSIIEAIQAGKVYKKALDMNLEPPNFQMSTGFIASLIDSDDVCDKLSVALNQKLGAEDYQYICDIVSSKTPQTIRFDEKDESTGEFIELRNRSSMIGSLKLQRRLKVYVDPSQSAKHHKEDINNNLKEIIEGL